MTDNNELLRQCIASGQVSASQVAAHHAAGEIASATDKAAPACKECDGTGTVAGSQAHFACPQCKAAPAAVKTDPCPGCMPGGYCKKPSCGRLIALNAAEKSWPTVGGYPVSIVNLFSKMPKMVIFPDGTFPEGCPPPPMTPENLWQVLHLASELGGTVVWGDAPQAAPAAVAGPSGWRFNVNRSDDRVWLTINTPHGASATLSAAQKTVNGDDTIVAQVLDYLADSLAAPTTQAAPQLPERDASVSAEQQGLFRKFDVRRADGTDKPGGKHHGCRYFVLDVDHDPCAGAALTAYAAACEATHPALAADLRTKWGAMPTTQAAPQREVFDEDGFRAWVIRNLPDNTIIGNSAWWADHLAAWVQRFMLAAPQAAPVAQGDALTPGDADQLEKVITDFEECGETDVPDETLQRFAAMGYLECVHYNVLPAAHEAIDAARSQAKEGGA